MNEVSDDKRDRRMEDRLERIEKKIDGLISLVMKVPVENRGGEFVKQFFGDGK